MRSSTSSARLPHALLTLSLVTAATCALAPNAAYAQSESGRAAISGSVKDGSGAIISTAIISVRDRDTGQTRTAKSDGAGFFSFTSLTVGNYVVEATAPGFGKTRLENVTLTVGQDADFRLVLTPETVSATVVVNAEDSELIPRTAVDNATIIGGDVVENLPSRGRNFTDFALLSPGISQEGDRFGLVVNGQRSSNANISIDGVDFNDPLQGGQRGGNDAVYFFPQVAVREFQVVRTGVAAEFGRTNAGFVNVVTKSGTNRFHGEALYTNRNPTLTWADALNDPGTDNVQNQYAFAVGGPIRHDRLFFFAGIEKNDLQTPYFVRFTCPATYFDPTGLITNCAQNAGNSLTALTPALTNLQGSSFGVNNPLASTGRLDWQISPRNTALIQYMSTFLNGIAFGSTAVQAVASSANTLLNRQSQAGILGLTTVLSATRTNDAHFQYAYDNRQQVPVSSVAEIDIGDLGTLGGASGGTYIYRAIREELVDNYTWLLGRHTLRFGVDLNVEPETQQREAAANGLWTIDTYANYLAALPVSQGGKGMTPLQINVAGCAAKNNCSFQFTQTLPSNGGAESRYRGTQYEYAGYLQDALRLRSNLTLNLGLRYEAELEPQGTVNPAIAGTGTNPSDLTQFQPRVGLAWDIFGTGKTLLRASTGLFDAHTPAYILARNFTDNGITNATLNSTYDQSLLAQVPYLGSFSSVPVTNILNDIYVTDPHFRNPRSAQVSVALEQQLQKRTSLILNFVQNETYALQHRLNTNLFAPTIDPATLYPRFPSVNPVTGVACSYQGINIPCRPNSTIAAYHVNYSTAHSTYRALQVQFKYRYSKKLQLTANYTWASSRDDDSNERDFNRELALDPLCTACYNKGYSKQDIRDQFNIHTVYYAPYRFTFTSSFITRSPLPFNAVTSGSSADVNNDGNTSNDRPILCSQVPFTVCPLALGNTAINAYKGTTVATGVVTGRNTFRGDGFLNWDMRLIKGFRIRKEQELQFSIECLNCSRSSNLNLGANQESKFTHAQSTINPFTGYYYSSMTAGQQNTAYGTQRSGGPRQIQLDARYLF